MSNAKLISVVVPSNVNAGQNFTATITMQNTGADTWNPTGTNDYALSVLGDSTVWAGPNPANPNNRFHLQAPVPPNGTAVFNCNLIAPAVNGVYPLNLQMLEENVDRFGDIVQNPVTVSAGSTPPPANTSTLTQVFPVPDAGDKSSLKLITPAFNCQTSVPPVTVPHTITWTNTSKVTYAIEQIRGWLGVTTGIVNGAAVPVVADVDMSAYRQRAGESDFELLHIPMDHYAETAGAGDSVATAVFDVPLPIKPGDSVTIVIFANQYAGPQGQFQGSITLIARG